MYDVINQKYMLRQHVKQEGHKRNRVAYEVVRAGILKANSVDDSMVISAGPGISYVRSLSTAGQHQVSHDLTASSEASCTCRARRTQHVCWHIIKSLLLAGASEDQLLKRLGIYWGSKFGGYSALYETVRAAAAVDSAAADSNETPQPPQQECTINDRAAQGDDAPQACAGVADAGPSRAGNDAPATRSFSGAPGVTCGERGATREKALAAVDRLRAASDAWSDDSDNWQRLYFHAEQALHDLQRGLAQASPSNSAPGGNVLLPNPNAPAGYGLKRLPDFLEGKGGKRRRGKASCTPVEDEPPLEGSPATGIAELPHFLPVPRHAKVSVLAEMKAKADKERQDAAVGLRRSAAAVQNQPALASMPAILLQHPSTESCGASTFLQQTVAVLQLAAAAAMQRQQMPQENREKLVQDCSVSSGFIASPLSAMQRPAPGGCGSTQPLAASLLGADLSQAHCSAAEIAQLNDTPAALRVTCAEHKVRPDSKARQAKAMMTSGACHSRRERRAGSRGICLPARLRD